MEKKQRRTKSKLRTFRFVLLTILLIGLTTTAICGTAFALYIHSYINPTIDIDPANLSMNFTSIVYYEDKKTGEMKELEKLHGTENRIWADISDMPKELGQAFVAIEDSRFYKHNGVDWKRTLGAAVHWLIPSGKTYGGSTITQQLIKNLTDDDEYSVQRKITEIMRAIALEKKVKDKDKILELYLNTIYLGRNSYGVNTAAKTYFGKALKDLNLAECAIIAGITQNPSKYDPFRFPDNIKKRQEVILSQMLKQKMITKEAYEEALKTPLDYKYEESKAEQSQPYSYFTDAVIYDVIDDLVKRKGYSKQFARTLVSSGGLKIYSTVDLAVQNAMEEVYENDANFPNISKNGTKPQSAMIILDPYTGDIKGVVGGRGKKEGNLVLNRATQSKRQPGSAIKPVSVYAPALDEGIITPYSVETDMPLLSLSGNPWPKNENRIYSGQMTIKRAVELSINTVAVRVMNKLTPKKSFDFMTKKVGFTTLVASKTLANGKVQTDIDLAPMTLGGLTEGVTVKQLAAGYTPFANKGMYTAPRSYTKVLDSDGAVLLENDVSPSVAFENEKTSYYMNELLRSAVNNGTGRAAKISGMDTAGKTGTTTSNKDRWFVGYTPYYLGAVWFGYDKSYGLPNLSSNPSVAVWKTVMARVHDGLAPKKFDDDDGFVNASYCIDSGLSPTEWCSADPRGSRVATGRFYKGDAPTSACNLHKPVEIDKETKMLATDFCPPANLIKIGLLDLTRLFPSAVTVTDQQYCITLENEPIGEGILVSSPNASTFTKSCTIHTTDSFVDPENPPDDSENDTGEEPTEPEIPDDNGSDTENPPADNTDNNNQNNSNTKPSKPTNKPNKPNPAKPGSETGPIDPELQ